MEVDVTSGSAGTLENAYVLGASELQG